MNFFRLIALFSISFTTLLAQAPPTYTISTLAGINPSGDAGPARSARLNRPAEIVVDPQGIVYFCDRRNYRIRRIGRDQTITTVAGGGDVSLVVDGQLATAALLFDPVGLALNPATNTLYFSDSVVHLVYAVNLANGTISIVAGSGAAGSSGDGGSAKRARLNGPRGLAYDSTLGLLIADTNNHRIRRVDLTTGAISVFAGSGTSGFSGDGTNATTGQLFLPYSVAAGVDHTIYIADWGNGRIRRVGTNNILSTIAGLGFALRVVGDNGPALSATFDAFHVTVAPDGTLYVADQAFHRIRRITPAGIINTIGGVGTAGFSGDGGLASIAQLDGPTATAVDSAGGLYFSDELNHRLRRISLSAGLLDTVAGRNRFVGESVAATGALLTAPEDVAFDAAGNLYFADTGNHCVRRIARDGLITTVAGVGGESGRGAENIQATASRLKSPSSVAVDTDGTLYIADRGNSRIRRVDPTGLIRTISGNDEFGVEVLALQAAQRRLYFTDSRFHQVLRLDLANPNAIPDRGQPQLSRRFHRRRRSGD